MLSLPKYKEMRRAVLLDRHDSEVVLHFGMSMGKGKRDRQPAMGVTTTDQGERRRIHGGQNVDANAAALVSEFGRIQWWCCRAI